MASTSSILILASLFVVGLVWGQTTIKQEWAPQDFPNPQINSKTCGFPNNSPAYICDPNGILGSDVRDINWILADAAHNSTKCPCSQYYCETRPEPKGYKIGVALVRRMKPQFGSDGKPMSPEDLAQQFAYVLKDSQWKMGKCEEDIIVFYSVDDKMLSIFTGSTAGQKLTPYYRNMLAYKIGSRLNEGQIVQALNVLLHDMKVVLNCDSDNCALYESPKSHNTATTSASVSYLMAALFVLVASFCWH